MRVEFLVRAMAMSVPHSWVIALSERLVLHLSIQPLTKFAAETPHCATYSRCWTDLLTRRARQILFMPMSPNRLLSALIAIRARGGRCKARESFLAPNGPRLLPPILCRHVIRRMLYLLAIECLQQCLDLTAIRFTQCRHERLETLWWQFCLRQTVHYIIMLVKGVCR